MIFTTRHARLRLVGVLGGGDRAELQHRLDDVFAADCIRLDVDCGRVRAIGVDLVRDIARAEVALRRRGGALVIARPSEAFVRTAAVAETEHLFDEPSRLTGAGARSNALIAALTDLTARLNEKRPARRGPQRARRHDTDRSRLTLVGGADHGAR
jgi:hypothetical protein